MEEVLEEHLHSRGIGTECTYVELQECREEDIVGGPGDIVRFVESIPTIVGTQTAECHSAIAKGEDAEQCNLLSPRDLQVPVEKGRQHSSEKVLCCRDNGSSEQVCSFVKAMILVAFQPFGDIYLIPKRRYWLASENRRECESNSVGDDEGDGGPGRPAESFRYDAR